MLIYCQTVISNMLYKTDLSIITVIKLLNQKVVFKKYKRRATQSGFLHAGPNF